MPKNIVVFDHDGTLAHVLYEALVTEGYAVHCATQPERFFALVKEVQPDLLLLGWPTFVRIEAELLASCETGALDEDTPLIVIGLPSDPGNSPPPATEDERDELGRIRDELNTFYSIGVRFCKTTKHHLLGFEKPSEASDVVNWVNAWLGRPERSAAIAAGGQARTYSYPTPGPQAHPHLQWSLPFPEQVSLCHPILVADQRVYVLDAQGSLYVLEANTGKVVWSFHPGHQGGEQEDTRVTAVGLQTKYWDWGEREIYVACAPHRICELDPESGQILHAWETPEQVLELLPLSWYDFDRLFLVGCTHVGVFVPLSNSLKLDIPVGLDEKERGGNEDRQRLTLYHCPESSDDPGQILTYGCDMLTNSGDIGFRAQEIYDVSEEDWRYWSSPFLSDVDHFVGDGHFTSRPGSWMEELIRPLYGDDRAQPTDHIDASTISCIKSGLESLIYTISSCNMPVLDEILYVWAGYVFCSEVGVYRERAEQAILHEALFAVDPMSTEVKWCYTSPDPVSGAVPWLSRCSANWGPRQLVAAAQQIFVIRADGIEAVDVQTHHHRWQWQADFGVHHALAAEGLLYVVGTQGQLVALDLSSGETRWTWQVEGEVLGKYSTVDHGTLYVATTHALYALRSYEAMRMRFSHEMGG